MLRVERFLRYTTPVRCARHLCSSTFAEKWIQETFLPCDPLHARPVLNLPDFIINAPSMDEKQIFEGSKSLNCIINTDDSIMGLPLIDFDVQKYSDDIIDGALVSPLSHRIKPIFGVMRGMGGGKTRALEEIRRKLLQNEDTLPLAITFNGFWHVTVDKWERKLDPKHPHAPELYLALSILSRMASMLYNKPFDDIITAIIKNIQPVNSCDRCAPVAKDLIRAFIKYIVEDVSRHREKPVTKFILLFDETMKIVDRVDEVYGKQDDIIGMVRDTLLNTVHTVSTREGQAYALNVGLALSSFDVGPFGKSTSGRPVFPIVLPDHLNSQRVCDEIFLKHSHIKESSDINMLRLVAASLNELPRLVEFANAYISENVIPEEKDAKRTYYSKLYEYVCTRVNNMYMTRIENELILYSIVFG